MITISCGYDLTSHAHGIPSCPSMILLYTSKHSTSDHNQSQVWYCATAYYIYLCFTMNHYIPATLVLPNIRNNKNDTTNYNKHNDKTTSYMLCTSSTKLQIQHTVCCGIKNQQQERLYL